MQTCVSYIYKTFLEYDNYVLGASQWIVSK